MTNTTTTTSSSSSSSNTTLNVNEQPPHCANGCRFYGNPSTRNLCSVCFRDFLKKASLQETQIKHNPDNEDYAKNSVVVYNEDTSSSASNMKMTTTPKKINKINRCDACNKRVGLTGFKCRCGGLYCGSHRYPEEHGCGFDHKMLKLEALSEELCADAADFKGSKLDYRA